MHSRSSLSTPKDRSIRNQIYQSTKLSRTGVKFFSTTNPQQNTMPLIGTGRTNKLNNQQQMMRHNRNMKFRLQNLEKRIETFKNELHIERMEVRENIERCGELKQQFVWTELPKLNEALSSANSGLSKQIRNNKAAFQLRNNQIYDDCAKLWEQTEELRQKIFEIRMKVEEIDGKMGFKQGYLIQNGGFY